MWAISDGNGHEYTYNTDNDGCGLWRNDEQIMGTCQYKACKTISGMRKRIMKTLNN